MDGAAVRLATSQDAGVLARLLRDFNDEFDTQGPTADEFSGRFAMILVRDDVVAVLAEQAARPIGFAFLTLRPTPYYDGSLAQLEELYVVPELRNEGVGTALLGQAIEAVRARGAAEMHINVDEVDEDTRRFYESHGFLNIESGRDYRMLGYIKEF